MDAKLKSVLAGDATLRQEHIRDTFIKAISDAWKQLSDDEMIMERNDLLTVATYLQARSLDTFMAAWNDPEMVKGFLREMIEEYDYKNINNQPNFRVVN